MSSKFIRRLLVVWGVALALAPVTPGAHAQRRRLARAAETAPVTSAAPTPEVSPVGSLHARLDSLRHEQQRQGAVLDSFVAAQRPTRLQTVLAWVWPAFGAIAALFVLLALVGNLVRRR